MRTTSMGHVAHTRDLLEALIAEQAFVQHGVISLSQLRDFGLSAAATRRRVASGRLHRVHSGVYAVGHERLSSDGRYMAAVLACGEDSALSHRSASDKRSPVAHEPRGASM